MSTTLTTYPPALSLSDDPLMFGIKADNAFGNTGTYSRKRIRITGNPSASDSFTLDFDGIEQTFTCAASIDESGLQFRTNAGAVSTALYIQNVLAVDLALNYYISTYFTLSYQLGDGGEHLLVFTAKNYGPEYDISLTESVSWMVDYDLVNGVAISIATNHRVLLDLHIEETYLSGTFNKLVQLNAPVYDQSESSTSGSGLEILNAAWFDVGRFLKRYFSYDLPSYTLNDVQEINANVVRFKVSHAEKFGDPARATQVTRPSTVWIAMNGGTQFPFVYTNPEIWADWLSAGRFLTWAPTSKTIDTNQRDYLYLYAAETETYALNVKIYYSDGSSSDWIEAYSISTTASSVLCFPINYTETALANADGAKTVLYFKVQATNENSFESEIRTYKLEFVPRLDTSFIYFFNSFGVLECQRFVGLTKTDEVNANVIDGSITPFDSKYAPQNLALITDDNKQWEVTSPVIPKAWANHMRDLLLSERTYVANNNDFEPIVLTSRRITKSQTRESGYVVNISFVESRKNKHHSA